MNSTSQAELRQQLHNLLLDFAPREQIKPGLERIEALCEALGHPQKKFPAIHIAGTNGKGSVTALTASALQAAGQKVGVYTSPHLHQWNERILINQQEIDLKSFIQTIKALYSVAKQVEATVFELVTAVAFHHFAIHKVDLAVVETGLGGRFDATNVIDPEIVAITEISRDHVDYLGNELSGIAWEKAGIIKSDVFVITPPLIDIAQQEVKKECQLKNAKQIIVKPSKQIEFDWKHQVFDSESWGPIKLSMLGQWQGQNLAVALGILDQLQQPYSLEKEELIQGLEQARWPGRFEVIQASPIILLDGAHNEQGAIKLIQTLDAYKEQLPPNGTKWLLFGQRADKDYKEISKTLFPWFDRILLSNIGGNFGLDPATLVAYAQQTDLGTEVFEGATSALQYFLEHANPNDLICVTGSLYLVGDVRWQLLNDNR